MNGQGTISSAVGDDTIELQLTPEQLRQLSQAAEAAEAAESRSADEAQIPDAAKPVAPAPVAPAPVAPARRSTHMNIAKMAAAIFAYGVFAWWSASHLVAQPQPQVIAAKPAAVIPAPVLVTSAPAPTVRISNPFDATEVFEFPAGTSRDDGREQVAQILLQRARERQAQLRRIKPAVVGVRTASLYRSP